MAVAAAAAATRVAAAVVVAVAAAAAARIAASWQRSSSPGLGSGRATCTHRGHPRHPLSRG